MIMILTESSSVFFARANVLVRRFSYYSMQVKLQLFNMYCFFYDTALWENFGFCLYKMSKALFGFSKYSSVTAMLLQLGMPSFLALTLYCIMPK